MEKEEEIQPINHNYYLSIIKKLLGASFVAWVHEKDKSYLKVNIDKNSFIIGFGGGQITHQTYTNLINNIITTIKNGRTEIQESV